MIGNWHLKGRGKGTGNHDAKTTPNVRGPVYFCGKLRYGGYTIYVEGTDLRHEVVG